MLEFEFLSEDQYARMGFRCGLEIHQQLDTREKLFCHCPVGLTKAEPDMRIMRHMRPTLSELGEYDRTALMEFKTRKNVIYELFSDRTCTYEMDDTPPFPLNREALDIAIEIALLLNCKLVDEVHVTRKQYLDGSIPTGFQRTAIVGVDGWVPYRGRKIGIAALTAEEDSCREVDDSGHTITWKTDRLSTPLVEVITKPDMLSPREVVEVNRLIGDLMRATGKVRRGIGTVRQDVNVSIDGGTRVEIKGVPRIKYNGALTHFEALRQQKLLDLSRELMRRKLTAQNVCLSKTDTTGLFKGTSSKVLTPIIQNGGRVTALRLSNCKGIFNVELQPERTFADEVSGRVRVVACLDKLPNLLHSDKAGEGGLGNDEWSRIGKVVEAEPADLIALVFGHDPMDVETAAGEVVDRVVEAMDGVPNETRQPYPDGRTGFERILPGPDRMYPDTDTPVTEITPEMVERIREALPERPWERLERYAELGLARETAQRLARSAAADLFDAVVDHVGVEPKIAAHILFSIDNEMSACNPFSQLERKRWLEVFDLFARGLLSRTRLPAFVRLLMTGKEGNAEALLKEVEFDSLPEADLNSVCERVVADSGQVDIIPTDRAVRWLTGKVMRIIDGRFDGASVATRIQDILNASDIEQESE